MRSRCSSPASLAPLALAGMLGLATLAAGCGGSSSPGAAGAGGSNGSASSASSTQLEHALAFSRCMRAHGLQKFPDPSGDGRFPPLAQQALGVSKATSSIAFETCKHLLSSGGGVASPQQRQQKLAFGVKVAECLRAHGYPDFPDPGGSGQSLPPGIDTSSPRFQTTENACEKQARKALGLP